MRPDHQVRVGYHSYARLAKYFRLEAEFSRSSLLSTFWEVPGNTTPAGCYEYSCDAAGQLEASPS